jgi:hypothetical protein
MVPSVSASCSDKPRNELSSVEHSSSIVTARDESMPISLRAADQSGRSRQTSSWQVDRKDFNSWAESFWISSISVGRCLSVSFGSFIAHSSRHLQYLQAKRKRALERCDYAGIGQSIASYVGINVVGVRDHGDRWIHLYPS